jgi:cobalt-zinc-cadmium efflux system membrane fusion protein
MPYIFRTFPCLLLLLLLCAAGCNQSPPPSKYVAPKPAEKAHVESDLTKTTLRDDEVKSLLIRSEPVRVEKIQERQSFTGWVMVKQGNEVTLTAPVAGYVVDPGKDGALPIVGLPAKKGQELFQLDPVLTQVEQIQIAGVKRDMEKDLAKAQDMVRQSKIELDRMEKLVKEKIRQAQDVELARVKLSSAEADLEGAKDKLRLFGAGDGLQLKPVPVRSPRAGTVLTVPVSPGQFVPAAAPLVTVADLSELWVRVPVPENDLPRLDRQRDATVLPRGNGHVKGADGKPLRFEAAPVAFVPLVDPVKHTADLIYRLPPAGKTMLWAKDQMVDVLVPLGTERKESIVPYSAVVYDSYGGTWVYIDRSKPGDKTHVYERRRVELGPTVGGGVVIRADGQHPAAQEGERVVVESTAVLHSREFHRPPTRPPEK